MNELRINIAEAKAKLSQYVRRVKNGETILLCERNVPVAELRPLGLVEETSATYKTEPYPAESLKGSRKEDTESGDLPHPAWGAMKGTVLKFPDDFNEPEGDVDWEAIK